MRAELAFGKNPYTANAWAFVMCLQRCSQTLVQEKLKFFKVAHIYNDAFDDGRYFQFETSPDP